MYASLVGALRNRTSVVGVALAAASGITFLVLVALESFGVLRNPYAGFVVFVMVPGLLVAGLVLIPIGIAIERRRIAKHSTEPSAKIDLANPSIWRFGFFLTTATLFSLLLITIASYGTVHYTESQQFCGQMCHTVMQPEFVAHQAGAHGRVRCVECHVGAGARGFVSAKLEGTKRLALLTTGSYPRPIPTPTLGFPGVQGSCENCHRPDRFVGDVIRNVYEYADDEANAETKTTLTMHVGGPIGGTGTGTGIHWHMNRGNVVEFVALDPQREKIPYVRVSTPEGIVREYYADSVKPADIAGQERHRMDCLDCHSRPAHRFASSAETEVDAAIGAGQISAKIPFIRRDAVAALNAAYPTQNVGLARIDSTLRAAMSGHPLSAVSEADRRQAIGVVQAIYRTNVFPSMKIGWGTYQNQMGHATASTGCFRCHDDEHKTAAGVPIRQDCELCHAVQ